MIFERFKQIQSTFLKMSRFDTITCLGHRNNDACGELEIVSRTLLTENSGITSPIYRYLCIQIQMCIGIGVIHNFGIHLLQHIEHSMN